MPKVWPPSHRMKYHRAWTYTGRQWSGGVGLQEWWEHLPPASTGWPHLTSPCTDEDKNILSSLIAWSLIHWTWKIFDLSTDKYLLLTLPSTRILTNQNINSIRNKTKNPVIVVVEMLSSDHWNAMSACKFGHYLMHWSKGKIFYHYGQSFQLRYQRRRFVVSGVTCRHQENSFVPSQNITPVSNVIGVNPVSQT